MCVPGKIIKSSATSVTTLTHMDNPSFLKFCISEWNGLAKDVAEANTLDIFIYKKNAKTEPGNYRPVSVLSIMSKGSFHVKSPNG